MLNIPGYKIAKEIYNGSRTLVYRAIRETDALPVVIKLLKNPYPSFSELLSFCNQYSIAKNLNSPLIIQIYSLEPYQNGYALIMEDFGGVSLLEWQANSRGSFLGEFLEIAIALCKALDILYHERIIHKDIKPSNILINPETQQVKLIDFSIASLLPRETPAIVNPNVLEGTLAYISPEQTGRMNRPIDYRTDFYSLGVTFYELLTGELPFPTNDVMELVHSHIAKKPPLLAGKRAEIPLVISDIVMKLMAKNAEDRYQSALGLKYDLEKCLSQLAETGNIKSFAIGERDISDRFIIPDQLYGREAEVSTLLQAFERVSLGATEMMLVAGLSGIGKTAVVNEVHKPILRQRGYFIKGKYDQFQRNIPFSAFVQAFRDFIGQILTESDTQIQQWKHQILEAVGENGGVIIEVIPELEIIIGAQPPAIELSGTAAQNRFNLLFKKFTQVFTSVEHPLVIFLDDLQWADSASLNLIQLLMSDTSYLFLIGAYRDNEVKPADPLMLTLQEIQKNQSIINTITLTPLNQVEVNQLVADTLKCSENLAWNLSVSIYQKTQGNPFFTTQFLKSLYQENFIQFDFALGCWQCDITQVNQLALTDDVVAFMAWQLQKMPQSTQNILQLAACIGNSFDLATLAIVSQQSEMETAADLWKALQEGLILPISEVYKFYQANESDRLEQFTLEEGHNKQLAKYKFLHDRVQQAAYSLIPQERKQATHLQIGQLLQQNLSPIQQEEKLFDIVGHLNKGIKLIVEPCEQERLAQLNLKAGAKARNSTAYAAARTYFQIGLELLPENCWIHQYELALNLHIAAAEASYLNSDFESMEQIATIVLLSARTILDRVKIYEIQIAAQVLQSNVLGAIAVGRKALAQLGVELPQQPDPDLIGAMLQQLTTQLAGREIADLINLPLMTDPTTEAAMELLGMLFSPIIQGMPGLLPWLSSMMVSLSLQSGNTAASTTGYGIHGMVLCGFLEDPATGYAFGQLALNLLEKLHIKPNKSGVLSLFGCFIQHYQERLDATIPLLLTAYQTGIETGDFLHAGFALGGHSDGRFFSGEELNSFVQVMADYSLALAQVKQYSAQIYLNLGKQAAENFIEPVSQPDYLIGNTYNETLMLTKHHQDHDLIAIAQAYIYKLLLACYFANYTDARDYIAQAQPCLMAVSGTIFVPIFHFYAALTYLGLIPTQPEPQQAELLTAASNHQTILHQWAQYAPMNHLHKWYLVEAERHRVLGEKFAASECYDRAINLAQEHQFINEEALANELAAKFYLQWDKQRLAEEYTIKAYYNYARWGAKAKVNDLERRYPQLLTAILQSTRPHLSLKETLIARETFTSASSSSHSISNSLDLATILKATHAISGEIELEKLLSLLLSIVIENVGADKCVFMMLRDERLLIKGLVTVGTEPVILQRIPIEESQDIPLKLIYKVKHNQQTVVLFDATADLTLANDPYIMRQQPKSSLCSPILRQGQLLGILYLENNLATGAFTSERVELLNLICTQAAISLENARLYQKSQESLVKLQASETRFQNLANNIPGMVYQFRLAPDGSTSTPYVSSGCFDLYELEPELVMAGVHSLSAMHHPDDDLNIIQATMESAQNLTPFAHEWRIVLPSGTVKWVRSAARPERQADGAILWDGVLIDISDGKKAELALQQQSLDLEQALTDLRNAHLQIVQSEKMSALGNLVTGVAHEMNNPLGFIFATLQQTKPNFADIAEHLQLYQEIIENPGDEIQEHAAEIELDYLLEDLPKTIDAMVMACDRLKNISTSLRTFSRADKDYKVPFNIHQGIDSTILILKHRLKANEQHPAIEVITQYGDIPQIECFPGQLNQVFMNILANAIDALEEANIGKSFKEIQAQPNCITITTALVNKVVKIVISDNGKGMNAEIQQKIFAHLFTTKAVGKGTGLGLAIARQIVEETHGGKLSCNSVLGAGTEFIMEIPV
ncbi:AAA family ATPase [Calothrix sp. FACHB-1219]|uniref:trifunctional serine/threonine-protein kinase/ATP-binding protein/sensor histidine kinase n=1 Tax=unclassified Calothrix TaxID=2619626 RepID=UPI001681E06F|nr:MULTISPECIES: ATP-binding sensor histidine kinase [unclassified Calothrix]MBD2206030.1 AAA family ATPase [Calothrix sp. FACHB-168]MBD2220795.1 AAA family ATPase [Calothrix sp. FACHB-1219]